MPKAGSQLLPAGVQQLSCSYLQEELCFPFLKFTLVLQFFWTYQKCIKINNRTSLPLSGVALYLPVITD